MRYIVAIHKRSDNPAEWGPTYYLSKNGFRCYTAAHVYVFRNLADAVENRDHFAQLMTDFSLTVEQLPANVRSVEKAILRAVPVS